MCWSVSSSNCCFLTWIQICQEAGQVVCCPHLLKNFPVCCDPHKGFGIVSDANFDLLTRWCWSLPCYYQTQVSCVQWGQTPPKCYVGVWSRERFIAGPCKETSGWCPSKPKLPEGLQQNSFKDQVREGWSQGTWSARAQFSDWLNVNKCLLAASRWGLRAHCHQAVNFFHWVSEWVKSFSVVSSSLQPHGYYSSCNSPGQNTGVRSLCLLQGIFPTQGSNPGLPHRILYQLSHKGSPISSVWWWF